MGFKNQRTTLPNCQLPQHCHRSWPLHPCPRQDPGWRALLLSPPSLPCSGSPIHFPAHLEEPSCLQGLLTGETGKGLEHRHVSLFTDVNLDQNPRGLGRLQMMSSNAGLASPFQPCHAGTQVALCLSCPASEAQHMPGTLASRYPCCSGVGMMMRWGGRAGGSETVMSLLSMQKVTIHQLLAASLGSLQIGPESGPWAKEARGLLGEAEGWNPSSAAILVGHLPPGAPSPACCPLG